MWRLRTRRRKGLDLPPLKGQISAPGLQHDYKLPDEILVGIDEEADRYHSQEEIHPEAERLARAGVFVSIPLPEASFEQFAMSLPPSDTPNKVLKQNPAMFHLFFNSQFADNERDLELPPKLAPHETVTPVQVTRLLYRFLRTRYQRNAEENADLLRQVIGLVDRIDLNVHTEELSNADEGEAVIDERYAFNLSSRPTVLPTGSKMVNWQQLIKAIARTGKTDEAFALFESLEKRFRIKPYQTLFIDALDLCAQSGDTKRANKYIDYFFRCQSTTLPSVYVYSFDLFTCNTMMRAVTKDKYTMGRLWFKMERERIDPDNTTYSLMVISFVEDGKMNSAIKYLEEMKSKGLKPTQTAYSSVIIGLGKQIEEVRSKGAKPVRIHPQLIKYYEEAKATYALNTFLKKELSNVLLLSCSQVADPENVLKVIGDMQQAGIPLDNSTLRALIKARGANFQSIEALEVFWTMEKRHGLRPTKQCLFEIFMALVTSGRFDLVIPTAERARQLYHLELAKATARFIFNNAINLHDWKFVHSFAEMLKQWPGRHFNEIVQAQMDQAKRLMESEEA